MEANNLSIKRVVFLGMYEWADQDINDTVRCLVRAWPAAVDRIYIDPPRGLRAGRGSKLGYILQSLGWRWREAEKVRVGVPPLGFLPVRLGLRRWANRRAARSLDRTLRRRYGGNWREDTLVYVSSGSYTMTEFIRALAPQHLLFHILDDSFAFPTVRSDPRVRAAHEEFMAFMMGRSNLVIAVSRYLADKYGAAYGRRIHVVRNGVDVAHFSRDFVDAGLPEMAVLPQPVLMFIGAVTSWIDLDLLDHMAEARPDWTLVLIGPCYEESIDRPAWERLTARSNVRWLGAKPYGDLPRYIHFAAALLLPRTMAEHSLASDPLKLYEYMATGRPVVATGIPAVEEFGEFVYIAGGAEDFVAKVEEALASWSVEGKGRQLATVHRYSWASRVQEITALLGSTAREPRKVEGHDL